MTSILSAASFNSMMCTEAVSEAGVAGKTPFVTMVALNKEGQSINMRMTVVEGFKTKAIGKWAKRHLASGSAALSD